MSAIITAAGGAPALQRLERSRHGLFSQMTAVPDLPDFRSD
jgi:hypothetical protein